MDDIRTVLNAALKEAMVNKDALRRDVIRMLLSAVKQVEIDSRKTLTSEEIVGVLQKEAKKRRDSIEEAERVGRAEIAEEEKVQLAILESFLPKQLSRDEIAVLVQDAIRESGAASAKEMGKVMAVLMPKVKGVADGKLVNEVVREFLK